MKKLKDGTKTWIESRVERIYNNYQQYREEFIQSHPIDDQDRLIQPSQEESMDIWIKAVGGVLKGRIYGLGSQCSFGRRTSGFFGASFLSLINQDELELVRKKLAEINDLYLKEKAAREEEAKRREEEEKRRRKQEERRRKEEERRRKEEERRKDNEFRRVTGDVEYLKSQLKSLLASVLPHFLPPSDNKEYGTFKRLIASHFLRVFVLCFNIATLCSPQDFMSHDHLLVALNRIIILNFFNKELLLFESIMHLSVEAEEKELP